MNEFDLIERYFNASKRPPRKDVLLAIGDDCAVTTLKLNQRLATTTDTLVSGTHFLPDISPEDLAYKSVAVNLSDLAAMGAEPAWLSLALTLPEHNAEWLNAFSYSFFEILDHYNVDLIGGDTTKGPLSITITAQGILPKAHAALRHQAQVGDWIFVSGSLGDSAAGLQLLLNPPQISHASHQYLLQRHLRPTPRVLLGLTMLPFVNAAIDISDGLLADLGHILKRSQCGAVVHIEQLPLSSALLSCHERSKAEWFALTGGEDYELCFTVPDQYRDRLEKALSNIGVNITCIGQILPLREGFKLLREGQPQPLPDNLGFDHFR